MYVVMGATGHTGSVVAEKLLAAGKKVRVIGRDASRLGKFTQRGAEAVVADVTNSAAMNKAFVGAEAVYALIPPNSTSPEVLTSAARVSDAIASALKSNGVPYAVLLSSIGADKADKTGPVVGLHHLEEKLQAIPSLNALFLRPGYFMENLLPQVGVIKSFGNMAGPVKADLPLPMIATRDIAAVAADALLASNFQGKHTRELLGPREVTYNEAAKVIGAAIDKPDLRYLQLPNMQLKPILVQMGMSPNMADLLLEMTDALNSGHMKALEPRSPQNTTPTAIETFAAEVFVPAYRGAATHA